MSTLTTPTRTQPPTTPPRTPRSSPGKPRPSGWSDKQRVLFFRACAAAGITEAQRYIVMRHCGCPLDGKTKRPSVKHPRNTNAMFEQCMAVAEAQAGMRHQTVPRPREFRSWREAAESGRQRLITKARGIVAEAIAKMPGKFDAGLEQHICEHTTDDDDGSLAALQPRTFEEADGGQLLRIIEALRAWIGREFTSAGIEPSTFTVPPEARRRAART